MRSSRMILLLGLSLLAGCVSVSPPAQQDAVSTPSLEEKIRQADELFGSRNYQQAFTLYSEARAEAAEEKIFQLLQVKIAGTLYEMNNLPAALAALSPMPELPEDLNDCRKLVMAARILHRMKGKPEHVEALLEVALDNSIGGEGSLAFKASGYAELGRVYVANGKTARAVKCFEYAAGLYARSGDAENAAACKNIMEYLR